MIRAAAEVNPFITGFESRLVMKPIRTSPSKNWKVPTFHFLQQKSTIADFLNHVFQIVDEAVENYIERGFSSLQVNFGCTGGQHRSVYSADQLAKHLKEKYGVKVELKHIEQERKGWVN